MHGSGLVLHKRFNMINELKETHNQNVDQQNGFHHLLDEMGIPYIENGIHLTVGDLQPVSGWIFFISVHVRLVEELIKRVVPVLWDLKLPFFLLKNDQIVGKANDFWFGAEHVGRVLTVFSIDKQVTANAIQILRELTDGLSGPQVGAAIRVSETIYVACTYSKIQTSADGGAFYTQNIEAPKIKGFPFAIEHKYKYWKRKRILNRRYVPLVMINHSPKGDLLKAVDLKGFKFNWCFIKEGKRGVFEDMDGRNIKHRLKWQMVILNELQGHIPVPKFIDYFEHDDESYLVMEFLDGVDLHRKIYDIRNEKSWSEVSPKDQQELLRYYLAVLDIIEKMHELGFVHRDATAGNFMVVKSGDVFAIDLELAYSLGRREPTPPFTLGALGYISPEQFAVKLPTKAEDIYTMGALLLHVVTGKHPSNFNNQNNEIDIDKVKEGVPELLEELVLSCLNLDPEKRPAISVLRDVIKKSYF